MRKFDIIACVDQDLGIGKGGCLPWKLPGDLMHFRETTCVNSSPAKKNAVIMGRKTWDRLPENSRPLPDRLNLVLTRNRSLAVPSGVLKFQSLEEALLQISQASIDNRVENVFVIGGEMVFRHAVKNPSCCGIHLTHILAKFDCDAFFPTFCDQFKEGATSPRMTENGIEYFFATYHRIDQF